PGQSPFRFVAPHENRVAGKITAILERHDERAAAALEREPPRQRRAVPDGLQTIAPAPNPGPEPVESIVERVDRPDVHAGAPEGTPYDLCRRLARRDVTPLD